MTTTQKEPTTTHPVRLSSLNVHGFDRNSEVNVKVHGGVVWIELALGGHLAVNLHAASSDDVPAQFRELRFFAARLLGVVIEAGLAYEASEGEL